VLAERCEQATDVGRTGPGLDSFSFASIHALVVCEVGGGIRCD
jgi:hypothetical protein